MALVNRSGNITVGGVSQVIAPANDNRHGFAIQNYSSQDIYINLFGTASANPSEGNIKLSSGVYWEAPFFTYNQDETYFGGNSQISVYGATTGQQFMAMEW